MDKLKNISSSLHRALQVMYIGAILLTVICTLLAIVSLFAPESFIYGDTESIVFGPLTMIINPDAMLAPIGGRLYALLPFLGRSVFAFFLCRLLRVLDRILWPMSLGKPFAPDVAPSLKKLAWFSLIGGIMYEFCTNIWPTIILNQQDLETFFNMEIIQEISLDHSMNFWFLPIFLFLMLIGHVFEYGQQLQKLEDETL